MGGKWGRFGHLASGRVDPPRPARAVDGRKLCGNNIVMTDVIKLIRSWPFLFIASLVLAAPGCSDRSTDTSDDGGVGPHLDNGGVVKYDVGAVTNTTCAKAQRLALVNGTGAVSGSTSSSSNEYGTSINCGSSSSVMRGPQTYHKVKLTGGKTYKFTLSPQYYGARMYIFTGCGVTKINADCSSGGKTGAVSASITRGRSGSVFFKPLASGDFIVAIDSTSLGSSSNGGNYTLAFEPFSPPTNGTCANAKTLTLSGGTVSVSSTTEGLNNQYGTGINCGQSYYTLNGPQAYFKLAMTAGKSYAISLTPGYSYARFYVFGTACNETAINAACGSSGKTGLFSGAAYSGRGVTSTFSPPSSGTYTIAVDATSAGAAGTFDLTVTETTAPTNGTCAKAKAVTVGSKKVTVTGTTHGTTNEYADKIKCGSTSAKGPQAYYKLSLTPGKTYKFTIKPTFSAKFYIFGSTCSAAQIDTDCASKGQTGDYTYSFSSSTSDTTIYFKAKQSTYHMAIDSSSDSYAGTFTVEIEPFTPAQNGTCAGAKTLTLSAGKASTTGDTTGVTNEYGTAINCGNYSTILYGNQLYYRVKLTAGKTYDITVTPDYYSARFYIFGSTCTTAAINTDCASKGATGDVSSYGSKGSPKSITFKPTKTADYTIAVDGTSTRYFGTFSLAIAAK